MKCSRLKKSRTVFRDDCLRLSTVIKLCKLPLAQGQTRIRAECVDLGSPISPEAFAKLELQAELPSQKCSELAQSTVQSSASVSINLRKF